MQGSLEMQAFLSLLDLQVEDLKNQLVLASGDELARLQGAAQRFIALRQMLSDHRPTSSTKLDGAYI